VDDATILAEHLKISQLERGCRFCKVDIHVHSPGSFDFAQDEEDATVRKTLREMSGVDFVTAWLDAGFDMIAITDHNSGAFLDEAIDAATTIRKSTGRHLAVLPGVELTVSPGIHLLAIFPSDGTALINDLLSALGLSPEDRGKEESLIVKSFNDIASEVRKRGGLLVAAHCNSTKGVIQEIAGQARIIALRSIDALENSVRCTNCDRTVKYVRDDLHCSLPFVCGSDNHNPTKISDSMWLKMAPLDYDGLKQLVFEPELRISLTMPDEPAYARIIGLTATQGIYAAEHFGFSPNLNVVIGGRGAGKSALIDLLRFAFEVEPSELNDRRAYADRIGGFLTGVGDVLVVVVGTDGEQYAIVRSGAFSPDKKLGPQFTERSKVYQLVTDGVVLRDVHPKDVLPVEFYGQGEVANLAKRLHEQLRMIDDNLDLEQLKEQEQADLSDAEVIEDEITATAHEVTQLNEQIEKLPSLRARAEQLGQRLEAPVFARRELWTREQVFFQAAVEWVDSVEDQLQIDIPDLRLPPVDMSESPNASLIQTTVKSLEDFREATIGDIDSTKSKLQAIRTAVDQAKTTWNAEFEKEQEDYRKELATLGAANLAAVAAEHTAVQKDIQTIEHVTTPKRDEAARKANDLYARRAEILGSLAKVRDELRSRRVALVEQLNQQLKAVVRIQFDAAGDRTTFADGVTTILERSGMTNRPVQVAELCNKLTPAELVKAVREKDVDCLCERGGLTAGNATLIQRHLDEPQLMAIERIGTPSMPRVMLKREGESSYSDLSKLSVGEQCSAVLSIVLLNKAKPLVIDQPEDELDHAFVTQSIVESMRAVKVGRQILAATHNPNIPVLGDAEIVFRVSHRPGADICEIKCAGGIEEPAITAEVQMLEGGAEAFERRRRKYEGKV
jgi:histidinol phosphatase-like PHP family hydrolase